MKNLWPHHPRLYWFIEDLRSFLMAWRWANRRECHGSIRCCQRTDWPNDNHRSKDT